MKHTPEIDRYIFNVRLRGKLNDIFYDRPDPFHRISASPVALPPPDYHFEMANFKNLRDLEEFMRMIVFNANYFKDGETTTIRLLNEINETYFMRHPWYFADGLFSYGEQEVLATPFTSLSYVDLYTSKNSIGLWDPLMIQNGIVAISTSNRYWEGRFLAKSNVIRYRGFPDEPGFVEMQPELNGTAFHGPDLRPVVYWEPGIAVQAGKPQEIRFRTTDNPGIFLISIEGMSSSGKLIQSRFYYKTRLE
jgi:hypothetical protein